MNGHIAETSGTKENNILEYASREPNYYKEIFPYEQIPKVHFGNGSIDMNLPEQIWITDTTFRDGQQSMSPFSIDQISDIFDFLNKIDNGSGIIRQTEFFLYGKKDRDALIKCMEKGYRFPEITSWIRANKNDMSLVKDIGLKETGILMSCSDYHIYRKLNMDRKGAADMYMEIVEEALAAGILPRCHFEDITRADLYGFVIPLVKRIKAAADEAGSNFKIRACDTLGFGVPYSGAELPRSVQGIMWCLRNECGLDAENIEWHGHNDFYNVVPNAVTAWLYGCASINTTLFGIGERTGNCPIEAMLVEYGQLKGTMKNLDLSLITEAAEYFEKVLNYKVPAKTPFVGSEFNVTRAGIHADGVLKDEEIYNIFDTEKILNRPVVVAVNQYSGTAGIAAWINTYFRLKGKDAVDKRDSRIEEIKKSIDMDYDNGRTSVITNEELTDMVKAVFPEVFQKKTRDKDYRVSVEDRRELTWGTI